MGHSHGIKWTEEKIRIEILKVIKTLNIDRMPSRTEIVSVTGNNALTCKISKTKGYYGWAEDLGLKIKKGCTTYGKDGEKIAAELLTSKGFKVQQMSQNYPYDLLIDNFCKVDVKSSRLHKGETGNYYSFALNKKYPTCDFYMLIAEDDTGKKTVYIIPSGDAQQRQIGIGEKTSIYAPYINRFDLMQKYIAALNTVKL